MGYLSLLQPLGDMRSYTFYCLFTGSWLLYHVVRAIVPLHVCVCMVFISWLPWSGAPGLKNYYYQFHFVEHTGIQL